jgi:elongation factor P--(R)-beta-lysine ligase
MTRQTIEQCGQIYGRVRHWFEREGFTEVRTNIAANSPGFDGYVVPFLTEWQNIHGYQKKLYLSSSPEFEMKGILAAGCKKIYQITRAFRNTEHDPTHFPEFNMLEWYSAGVDYERSMSDLQELIHTTVKKHRLTYSGRQIRLPNDFQKIRVHDIFLEHTGLDLRNLQDPEAFLEAARTAGFTHIPDQASWDHIFFVLFLEKVECELGKMDTPVILKDYPVQIASLARNCEDSPGFVERFECYIGGLELCNGYSELTDETEHHRRFHEMNRLRKARDMEEYPVPQNLLDFIRMGLGECAGVALGMDRLCMLLTDTADIRDIIPFDPYK